MLVVFQTTSVANARKASNCTKDNAGPATSTTANSVLRMTFALNASLTLSQMFSWSLHLTKTHVFNVHWSSVSDVLQTVSAPHAPKTTT